MERILNLFRSAQQGDFGAIVRLMLLVNVVVFEVLNQLIVA